ncbi:MAG: phosphoribosylformylglycinamidine synthase subunit PurQ [Lewinellaceae bacterium]|nr:phosphoribosylformylglycinamidine synthase subunit PurQ [Saprospiraceae bacterium]MCB9344818.1 phosphoribosylformylglycinamidine synthase subunit PurQ [Lewinellaceae bacterium]
MKFAVIVFPGSNCDDDMVHVLGDVMGQEVVKVWHKETALPAGFGPEDCVVLPGGFSYGDYVRAGAIARFSPIMKSVVTFAEAGGFVFGVCNGFQVLCECGLLPGVLLRNQNQQFICKNIWITPATENSPVTDGIAEGTALKIPIAHAEGRFYTDQKTLDELEKNDQILFRYCDPEGNVTAESNPNGALNNIAGICNAQRNVFGMMPHPERASEEVLGNTDGRLLFESLLKASLGCV